MNHKKTCFDGVFYQIKDSFCTCFNKYIDYVIFEADCEEFVENYPLDGNYN